MPHEHHTFTDTTIDARERSLSATGDALPPSRVLLVVTTATSSRIVELDEGAEPTIGRSELADIVLPEPSLSRLHARLRREGESVHITDLDSRNGVWVGGKRVQEVVTRNAETFILGRVTITVQVTQTPQLASIGLSNPGATLGQLEEECARSRAFGRPLSVMIVRGLRKGEPKARELGARVARALRATDCAGLYDRNAVLALLPETSACEAAKIAERLVRADADQAALVCAIASLSHLTASAEQLVSTALQALSDTSGTRRVVTGEPVARVPATAPAGMVRRSQVMLDLQRMVERLAPAEISVLLLGETGTGKELFARELHERSGRAHGPLKVVNCAAIPEQLTESVLFGHVRGAFTGAHRDQPGVFTQAHGGTIFLDEVGELPAAAQAALLRVLDTRRLCPVGGTREQEVAVRVVAATHRDLAAMAERGTFRLDLYHRLNSVVLQIPPLRERTEEIVPLMEHFLSRMRPDGALPVISADAVACLHAHSWPGNVRELRNVAERAFALFDGHSIECADLPMHIAAAPQPDQPRKQQRADVAPRALPAPARANHPSTSLDLRAALRQHEVALIEEALRQSEGNQRVAAGLLRMPLRTLERKLQLLRMRA